MNSGVPVHQRDDVKVKVTALQVYIVTGGHCYFLAVPLLCLHQEVRSCSEICPPLWIFFCILASQFEKFVLRGQTLTEANTDSSANGVTLLAEISTEFFGFPKGHSTFYYMIV